MLKTVLFVDLWESFYDRHPIYALSAILKKHDVKSDYYFSTNSDKVLRYVLATSPDAVFYSSFSMHIELFKVFDKKLKAVMPNIKTIIGGPGVTDKASQHLLMDSTIDIACIGEGDMALEHYILSGGECKNNFVELKNLMGPQIYFPYADLDSLPFPDRIPVYSKDSLRRDMPSKQFMGSRGCPYKCTYCHNHLEHKIFKGCGKTVRLKSVDYLIEEIQLTQKKFPLKTVVFQDDIFFVDKKWGLEFAEKFPRKVGLPFSCNVRSNLIDDDVASALKASGCAAVAWAIESGDADIRRRLMQRNMSDASILQAAELFNKYGIKHRINNVIGSPGETFEQMLKTLDLNIKAKPYLSTAHIFIPFQGLTLTNYALENGFVDKENLKTLPSTFAEDTVLNFSLAEKLRIRKLMLLFPIVVKFPVLFRNKRIFNFLFTVPSWFLRVFYTPINLYYWSKLYRVNAKIKIKLQILRRYFSYGV